MSRAIIDLAQKRAQKFLQLGLSEVSRGDYEGAREHFKASVRQHVSADALTYWGWMEYQLGDLEKAIQLCEQAIEVDPDFGNPYNDIGSYFVASGQVEEAIPWFEKAKMAKRYEPRHYPHINLGRIFLGKDMPLRALSEFKKALEFAPTDASILDAIQSIQESLH